MIWTIFLIGIQDSLNPLVFANVLIFLFVISTFCCGKKEFFFCGILFLLASLWASVQSVSGLFDGILVQKETYESFFMIYSVIGVILLALGWLNFLDWRSYKTSQDPQQFKVKWAVFFKGPAAGPLILRNPVRFFNLFAIFIILGFALVLLGSIWPQGKQFYIAFYRLAAEGSMEWASAGLVFYCLGNIVLFTLSWFFLGFLAPLMVPRDSKIDFISLSKISASAMFLAIGAGLEFFVFQQ